MQTGLLHGTRPSIPTSTFGRAEEVSSAPINDISRRSFTCSLQLCMARLSSTIKLFVWSPPKLGCSYSIKSSITPSSTGIGLPEPPQLPMPRKETANNLANNRLHPAGITTSACVPMTRLSVPSGMSASTVPVVAMSRVVPSVQEAREKERQMHKGMHPKFAKDLLWEEDRYPSIRASAELSEDPLVATPIHCPPARGSFHPDFLRTLDQNAKLFSVTTPIQITHFEYLLFQHPNRLFVDSLVHMLREGTWPWAQPPTNFPKIHDHLYLGTKLDNNEDYAAFAQEENDKETHLGWFSQPFAVLLPGMACMPTYVIARKEKLRIGMDHIAGTLSLNSLISKDSRAVPLCSLQQLGYQLCHAHKQFLDRQLVLFKCDVKSAYQLIPMHPYWQMLQAVKLPDGHFAINRNNVFGRGVSG